jgi:hypothetical protein
VNFSTIYKVFDTVVSVLDSKKDDKRDQSGANASQAPVSSFADQVETRLTNVVVAALREAFDRDHARMELERAHLDEQRRRAEENVRLELRRQAVDREIARLRLLAVAALVGWVVPVVLLVSRSQQPSGPSLVVLISALGLLLGSVGAAFSAQANVGALARESDAALKTTAASASLWLLIAGLALVAGSLLLR